MHNIEAPWLEYCRENYCKEAEPIQCKLDHELIEKVIKKMEKNTSPGRDLIVGHWIKQLRCLLSRENLNSTFSASYI